MHTLAVAALSLCAISVLHPRDQPASPPLAASPRTDHAVGYYDPEIERVVLVGAPGDPGDGDRDSAWSWSGAEWEPMPGDGPPGRVNAAAAYHVRNRFAVITGGSRKRADTGWAVVGDSWIRSGGAWRAIADIPARDHHATSEDAEGRVLLFGGIPTNRGGAWPGDTWRLDGERWVHVATDGPAGRGRAALACDRARGQVVLFGGASASPGPDTPQTFFGDTWLWNGQVWQKAAATGPRGRYAHAMVYDERRGVVLLYSGAAAHRDAPLSDMWQWDGTRWTEIRLSGPTPGHRYQPVMVYDRKRDRTVLYGGIGGDADTWEWDGRAWHRVAAGR
jgi:hypothetical protein